jgi:hypothetical protein
VLPLLCHLIPEISQLGGEGVDVLLSGLQLTTTTYYTIAGIKFNNALKESKEY